MGIDDLQQHRGACHCGAVQFTVMLPPDPRGSRCDCSICAIKGAVTVGAPLDGLDVTEGAELLTLYQFNTGTAKHWFCSRCGSYTHHQRRSDPNSYGVNVACLGLNPYHDFPNVAVVDGIHHARDTGRIRLAGRLWFEPNPE